METFDDLSLDGIPQDLSAFRTRMSVDPDSWGSTSALWIRTWYGNDTGPDRSSTADVVTRAGADEAYSRLWKRALYPIECHDEFDRNVFGPLIFDDNANTYGVVSREADDEVELMDDIPSFVLSALMRCPDSMEGSNESSWNFKLTQTNEDLALDQALLVMIADREACESGWVLQVALNHKGQVLHIRERCKAYQVSLNIAFWRDKCDPLDIVGGKENVVHYRDANQSGNGWDEDGECEYVLFGHSEAMLR